MAAWRPSRFFSIPSVCLLVAAYGLMPMSRARAQWWTAAPADFEDCAERAGTSSRTNDARAAAVTQCESTFAGRRKPGGGYTYHDFMQNRSFDIAGPNPTAAEQKMIDQCYALYLDDQRRGIILAAFARKQSEGAPPTLVDSDFRADVVAESTQAPIVLPRPRPKPRAAKSPDCASEPLACGWSKLSTGLKDIKDALFGAPAPGKTRRT